MRDLGLGCKLSLAITLARRIDPRFVALFAWPRLQSVLAEHERMTELSEEIGVIIGRRTGAKWQVY
jgi:hypothetical protein